MIKRDTPIKAGGNNVSTAIYGNRLCNGERYDKTYEYKFPTTHITFTKIRQGALHPTQKPVELLEYLIRTYTNEGDTILDNTMGSGSTGVACARTDRNFIGIELDEGYFRIAEQRIKEASKRLF